MSDHKLMEQTALVCMTGYSNAAVAKMLEAEALAAKALELREEALLLFARANQLALEFARIPRPEAQPVPTEEIDW